MKECELSESTEGAAAAEFSSLNWVTESDVGLCELTSCFNCAASFPFKRRELN